MALRDGFHYRDEVFEAAAKVVAFLGLEGYVAMQVMIHSPTGLSIYLSIYLSLPPPPPSPPHPLSFPRSVFLSTYLSP